MVWISDLCSSYLPVVDGRAIETPMTRDRLPYACQGTGESRLARTSWTNDADAVSGGQREADVTKCLPAHGGGAEREFFYRKPVLGSGQFGKFGIDREIGRAHV